MLAILYGLIWISFSGHFDFLLLSFGFISVLIVLYILRRMRVIDETPIKFQMNLFSFVTYCFWLLKEILKCPEKEIQIRPYNIANTKIFKIILTY